jgi:HAD superfamily hydrolase (TIGR01484 family)
MANEPKKLANFPAEKLRAIEAVFFDIDDTFSGGAVDGAHQWRILPQAYDAIWNLFRAGIHVVPVTGRPAGWCDMIARMWPVTAVVGENGAFYCHMTDDTPPRLAKNYLESPAVRKANAAKLLKLRRAILKSFPGAKLPTDQAFREFDVAIDYCEDVRRWPDAKVQKLLKFCRERGATAKLSSIHVNTWYGKYDKWTCVQRVMKSLFKMDPAVDMLKVVYLGDSPNDEPFFAKLPLTVGVANVRKFLGGMEHAPEFVTDGESGEGFAEFARMLLASRGEQGTWGNRQT